MCDDHNQSLYKPCPVCGCRALDNGSAGEDIQCGNEKGACLLAGYTLPVSIWEALPRELGSLDEELEALGISCGIPELTRTTRKFEHAKNICPVCGKAYTSLKAHMRWHAERGDAEIVKVKYTASTTFHVYKNKYYPM